MEEEEEEEIKEEALTITEEKEIIQPANPETGSNFIQLKVEPP